MLDYLIIGHVCKDILPDGGWRLGGTVLYAALAARNLGKRVGLLTRTVSGDAAFDLRLRESLPGVEILRQPAAAPTTFENVYVGGHRQQTLHAWAGEIDLAALPPAWRDTAIIHFAPVAREIDEQQASTLMAQRAAGLTGLTPQGFLREWPQGGGAVKFRHWPAAADFLPQMGAVIFSEEDVAAAPTVGDDFIQLAPITALTRGVEGAWIYQHGERTITQPAFPANQIEPTGAGDVFAAAFLCALHDTGDLATATRFACAAGAFAVEQPGLASVPYRKQIIARLDSKVESA